jgi:hypothetical protein
VEGFGKGCGVGDIGDEYFGALRRQRLQVSGASADDANLLPASEKSLRHHVPGIAACSQNYVHIKYLRE